MHDPFPFTHEPRPARVIQPHGSWAAPLLNTQWIGSTDTSQEEWAFGPMDYFVFETSFNTTAAAWVFFNMQVRADDSVDFFLNPPSLYAVVNTANPLAVGPGSSLFSRTSGPNGPQTLWAGLRFVNSGKNRIYARVKRTFSGSNPYSLGLNVQGTVFTWGQYSTLRSPQCSLKGSIVGRKYHDYELNFSVLNSGGNPDPIMPGVPIKITRTSPASPPYTDTAISDSRGDWSFMDLPPGKYTVSELPFLPCVQTAPWLPPNYTVSVSGGAWSSVTAATLTNLTNTMDLSKSGFGNWCDECASLYQAGTDGPPRLECECVPDFSTNTFNCTTVLKASFYNASSWIINRVRIEVILPPSGISISPTMVNIPAVPSGGFVTLPKLTLSVPVSQVGKAVCLRLSFINAAGANETVICVQDFCDYAPCATVNGGAE